MANKGNYIIIHRKMMDWEWYRNTNTKAFFLHCLLRANWKEGHFEGRLIMPGQFVTSYESLKSETGLSLSKIRTAVKHLELTGEIAHEKIPQGLIITVKNWGRYQTISRPFDTQIAQESHTNRNNRIRDNKLPKKEKNIPSESEELSDEEWDRMMEEEDGPV